MFSLLVTANLMKGNTMDKIATQGALGKIEGDTYMQTVGGVPCDMCNGIVHPIQSRKAVVGCDRCERETSPHSPSHFRCNHGAHCTRDYCW